MIPPVLVGEHNEHVETPSISKNGGGGSTMTPAVLVGENNKKQDEHVETPSISKTRGSTTKTPHNEHVETPSISKNGEGGSTRIPAVLVGEHEAHCVETPSISTTKA